MKVFTPILAEVADKEPTIAAIWCVAAFLCGVAVLLWRWRRVAGLIPLPFAAAWAWAMLSELHDPYVGPGILQELGQGYVVQAYVATLLPFALVGIGVWRQRDEAESPDSVNHAVTSPLRSERE